MNDLTPTQDRLVDLALRAGHYRQTIDQLREELGEANRLLRIVTQDWADRCDHPADCNCSMAQAIRYVRKLP